MAASVTTSTAPDLESDEWEVVHDDGFVYKRKKRRLDPTSLVRPPDPVPDPAMEQKERQKRKRKTLLELKYKYEREIGLWEHLSNTLKTMEESVKSRANQDNQKDGKEGKEKDANNEVSTSIVSMEKHSGSLVNELLFQVEWQEAIMRDFSQLCDVAEALCDAQDEKARRSFLDLPIWASPDELMASLCED